jgi:hypothetical protein
MNGRLLAALVLFGFWLGSLLASMVMGGSAVLGGATILAIIVFGYICLAHGLVEGRRLGSGPRVGDRLLAGTDRGRLLRDWYASGKVTIEQLDLLMGEVVAGRAEWKDLAEAVRLAADLKYRMEVRAAVKAGEIPERAARTYLKLPPGYFDGNLSAQEPENTLGWAEVRRGDGTSYWIRCRP